jgi:tetratricopeptide (TPR) repeat protein
MKLGLVKTCFWLLTHLLTQKDTLSIANNLYTDKQFKAAIEVCTSQIKKLNTQDALLERFLSIRAASYQELKDYKPAIQDYTNLIKLRPRETGNYVGLSYLYGAIYQYDKSIEVLKIALKLNTKDIYTLNNLSYYSSQAGKYDDAINYANEGLKYVTGSEWRGALLNNRGYGYIGLKKYTEALDDINSSIKLNPDNSFAYCYRAIANIHLKRMETVCSDLDKAKSLGAVSLTKNLISENCKN